MHLSPKAFLPALMLMALQLAEAGAQPVAPVKPAAKPVKVITSYQELLAWVPKDMKSPKGIPWTAVQVDAINEHLEKKLKAEPCTVELKIDVTDVPTWDEKLQIFSEISNREGYHVRFFGIFPADKKADLAKVKVGEKIVVTGTLTQLRYHTLWNQFTLSIVTNPTTCKKWQPGR